MSFTPKKTKSLKYPRAFGTQHESPKRTAPAFSLYSETLTPPTRNALGIQKEATPGPCYERPKSLGKQIESTKRSSPALQVEKTERDCLQVEAKGQLGPGSYKYVGSIGKQVVSTKRSHTGVKWGSPKKTQSRKRVVMYY